MRSAGTPGKMMLFMLPTKCSAGYRGELARVWALAGMYNAGVRVLYFMRFKEWEFIFLYASFIVSPE